MAALVIAALVSGYFGQPENVALGRPYTLKPAPNYRLCTDPGDKTQLTDGKYVKGYFWAQKGTVGWNHVNFVDINIDLGQVKAISGVSLRTAAGVAGVYWPSSILVFVSDDGKNWYKLCDLITDHDGPQLPPYGTYREVVLQNHGLKAHGRFVRVIMRPNGAYVFTDEIKVFGGPPDYLNIEMAGSPVSDPAQAAADAVFANLIRRELIRDIDAVRKSLDAAKVDEARRNGIGAKLDELRRRVDAIDYVSAKGFKAILPFMPIQREIYGVQAEIWRAEGKPPLRVWHSHRWAYIAPNAEPPDRSATPELSVAMMNGEVRAEVFNITGAEPRPVQLRIRIEGLPGGTNPPYIQVAEVLHVATRLYRPVPGALPPAERQGGDWVVTVPSGMVRQVWLQFRPADVPAGTHTGRVIIQPPRGKPLTVPLRLRISHLQFPAQRTLLLGGWSYTDGDGAYGVTPQNRDELIQYLREHGVNAPWASRASMPAGEYDDAGNMTKPPDTKRFDEWVEKWRGSKMYMVFNAFGSTFAGARIGTEKFNRAVASWARFWAEHLKSLGLSPSQLGLLISDEPHDRSKYELIAAYAKAIKAGAPEILIFGDPTAKQEDGLDTLMEVLDIVCPNRPRWIEVGWYKDYFGRWRQRGVRLWLYSCSGPTRTFDPYLYYLLQEWHVFAVGGEGSAFWSFSDTRGAAKWNDFISSGPGPYCPMYLGPNSVTNAKWMEAIREGSEDFEYLTMVKQRIAKLGNSAAAKRAQRVLDQCVQEVLATAQGQHFEWNYGGVDHDTADRVRRRLLRLLEQLH